MKTKLSRCNWRHWTGKNDDGLIFLSGFVSFWKWNSSVILTWEVLLSEKPTPSLNSISVCGGPAWDVRGPQLPTNKKLCNFQTKHKKSIDCSCWDFRSTRLSDPAAFNQQTSRGFSDNSVSTGRRIIKWRSHPLFCFWWSVFSIRRRFGSPPCREDPSGEPWRLLKICWAEKRFGGDPHQGHDMTL